MIQNGPGWLMVNSGSDWLIVVNDNGYVHAGFIAPKIPLHDGWNRLVEGLFLFTYILFFLGWRSQPTLWILRGRASPTVQSLVVCCRENQWFWKYTDLICGKRTCDGAPFGKHRRLPAKSLNFPTASCASLRLKRPWPSRRVALNRSRPVWSPSGGTRAANHGLPSSDRRST